MSSAIAALLPQRSSLELAVRDAHAYVLAAIRAADSCAVGGGHGPLHHFHALWPKLRLAGRFEPGDHLELEQPAFERAVEERRALRLLQPDHLREA